MTGPDADLFEVSDGLGLAVFEDGEVGLLEAGDGIAVGVEGRDVDYGEAGVDLEAGRVVRVLLGIYG